MNNKLILLTICLLIRTFAYTQTPKYVIDSLNKGADYALQEQNLKKALDIWERYKEEIEEDTLKIKTYLNIGASYVYYDNSNVAMSYLKEALELSKQNNNFQQIRANKLLATIYFGLENYEDCIQHLKPYIKKNYSKKDTEFIVDYYSIICSYAELKKYDSVALYINHFNHIISQSDTSLFTPNDKKVIMLINYIKVNTVEHNYREALNLLREGMEKGVFKDFFFFNLEKGILFKKTSNYDSSLFYFLEAKKNTVNIVDTLSLYSELYSLYKESGKFEKQKEIAIKIQELREDTNLELDYHLYKEIMDLLEVSKEKPKGRYIYVLIFIGSLITLIFLYLLYKKRFKTQLETNSETNKKEIFLTQAVQERIEVILVSLEEEKLFLNPDFNLNSLQKISAINRKYLTTYFNQKGVSFIEYINELRIKYAINRENNQLDAFGKYTLENKSKESGYKSVATYKKWYKKYSHLGKF